MSRRDRPSRRDRTRKPTRPSRGRVRPPSGGKGGFHHWRIPRLPNWVVPTDAMHDVHISDDIPFHAHRNILENVVALFHLVTPQMLDNEKGFYRSELNLREFGRLILSTDPKHNETWVWRE